MATYGELKAIALVLADEVGNTRAETLAETGLFECLKYISTRVILDGLVGKATYTWVDGDEDADLYGGDFNITDASAPLEPLDLYVNTAAALSASSVGVPYRFRRYLDWLQLKSIPRTSRTHITYSPAEDRRPDRSFTVDPATNKLMLHPQPLADSVLTLFYRKDPVAYNDANTPEAPAQWQSIMTNGATLFVKEMVRSPEQIINPYELFASLDRQIANLDRSLRGPRSRPGMKMHLSYEVE